jgi:hypothetical protein
MPIPVQLGVLDQANQVVPRFVGGRAVHASEVVEIRLAKGCHRPFETVLVVLVARCESGCKRMIDGGLAALYDRVRPQVRLDVRQFHDILRASVAERQG